MVHWAITCRAQGSVQGLQYDERQKRAPMFYYSHHKRGSGDGASLGKRLEHYRRGDVITLSDEESRHACMVLRLDEKSEMDICDGRGTVVRGSLLPAIVDSEMQDGNERGKKRRRNAKKSLSQNGAMVMVTADPVKHPVPAAEWHVAVACGSLKGGRGDWLVEKCAEIGALEFTPLLTERSPKLGGSDGAGREERWERLSVSVMKQSLQPYKMIVHEPCTIQEFLDSHNGSEMYVGAEGAEPLRTVFDGNRNKGTLLVGPEGDFTLEELEMIAEAGAHVVGLGQRRLRSETAAIVMLSFVVLQV